MTVRLPNQYKRILDLPIRQKVMLSALAASGCDGIAYYESRGDGYVLDQKMAFNLYGNDVAFEANISSCSADNPYYIPVKVSGGQIKSFVLLHKPSLQYNEEEFPDNPAAKLEMARFIIEHFAALLNRNAHEHAILRTNKHAFFMNATRYMFATYANTNEGKREIMEKTQQAGTAAVLKQALRDTSGTSTTYLYNHVLNVTDIMDYAVRAINDGSDIILNEEQAEMVTFLALLHDAGKAQTPFLMLDRKPDETNMDLMEFIAGRNEDHALFTLLTLLMYKSEAVTAAAHHHGFHRYGEYGKKQELKGKVRENFTYSLLKDDIAPSELPPLSRMMRVADVFEAMTGPGRGGKPFSFYEALSALYKISKTVNPKDSATINPDSIDPDYLCFMIAAGVFKAYGEGRRSIEELNEADKAGEEILAHFGWVGERRMEKMQGIRDAINAQLLYKAMPRNTGAGHSF